MKMVEKAVHRSELGVLAAEHGPEAQGVVFRRRAPGEHPILHLRLATGQGGAEEAEEDGHLRALLERLGASFQQEFQAVP